MEWHNESQWWLRLSALTNIFFCVLSEKENHILILNSTKLCKQWQIFNYWVNYLSQLLLNWTNSLYTAISAGWAKLSAWPFKSAVTPVWVTVKGSQGVGLSHETVACRRESSKSVHSQQRDECRAAAEMEIWLKGLLKNGYFFHTQGKREKKYVLPVKWILEEVRAAGKDCEHHLSVTLTRYLYRSALERTGGARGYGVFVMLRLLYPVFLYVLGLVFKVLQCDRLFKASPRTSTGL